jgi:hypothetical protein
MAVSGAGIDLSDAALLGVAFSGRKAAITMPVNRLAAPNVTGR